MAKIITVCNQKGGTGKTTTTVNLSAALAELSKKILVVDMDPQGNATSGFGVNKNEIKNSAYEILLNKVSASQAIIKNVLPNLDLIPCNIDTVHDTFQLIDQALKKRIGSEMCIYGIRGVMSIRAYL